LRFRAESPILYEITSAADLKFLQQQPQQALSGTSNRKAALDS
jgi:hypothetical protein